jgi:hypothetical protein
MMIGDRKLPYEPVPQSAWISETRPKSIWEDLAAYIGKEILLILDTSGSIRITGKLRVVRYDGIKVEVVDPRIVTRSKLLFITAASIATIEVVE